MEITYIIISAVIAIISFISAVILYIKNKDINNKYQEEVKQRAILEGRIGYTDELKQQLEQVTSEKNQIEREKAIVEEQKQYIKSQLQEFEKIKEKMLEAAKSTVMESANTISSKLLEDHKREMSEAKKQSEETTKKTTEELFKQFDTVQKAVASLKGDVDKTGTRIDTILNALKSPAGAGQIGEVGLENAFKSFGLEPNRDYIMQYSVSNEGKQLRPDAVLFLPNNMAMVIDSKASKFVVELVEAGEEKEEEVLKKLAKTMNDHLKALAGKEYEKAVLEAYKQAGKGDKINRILNVMYLPTDTALLKVSQADRDFMDKAHAKRIIPVGAAGLAGLIYLTTIEIGLAEQEKNQQKIIDGTVKLLDSVSTVIGYADGVGKGIKSAADSFEKFSTSINKRLLPRARNIENLGVVPQKPLPDNIRSYNVITNEPSELIEMDKLEDKTE